MSAAYSATTSVATNAARRAELVNGRAARMTKYVSQIGDFITRLGDTARPYSARRHVTAVASAIAFAAASHGRSRRWRWMRTCCQSVQSSIGNRTDAFTKVSACDIFGA